MIQLVDIDSCEEIYCQVHDMVLDLIISLSDEESFATILNGVNNSLPSKIRRLSLQSRGLEQKEASHAITRSKLHVRSLNVFGETKEILPIVDFQSLRVLDISGNCSSWENKHIRNIGTSCQLRYLGIHTKGITELPEDIGKLQNLETLDLRGTKIRKLPSSIAQLPKLVRLLVDDEEVDFVFSADMFGSMQALEEVSDICRVDNPEKFLGELGHLKKLRKISMSTLWISLRNEHVLRSYRERLGSSLNELGKYNLQYLHTHGDMGEYLFRDPCCTFPHLQDLKLVYDMKKVPKGLASLTNIIKLQIEVRIFDEEGLHILMDMPSLAYLQLMVLKSAGVMTISSNGFKLLEVFHYGNEVGEATGIEFAAGAMPAVRQLHLSWRADRVMLKYSDGPDMGIEHLSSLALLQIETDCSDATWDEVVALEAFVEKATTLHPNRHTLQLLLCRKYEEWMFKDDQEREMLRCMPKTQVI